MSDYDVDQEVALLLQHLRRLTGSKPSVSFGEVFEDSQTEQAFESLVFSFPSETMTYFSSFFSKLWVLMMSF